MKSVRLSNKAQIIYLYNKRFSLPLFAQVFLMFINTWYFRIRKGNKSMPSDW